MMRTAILAAMVSIAFAPACYAKPLYLGRQEIDTGDRAAISAAIERCAELADPSENETGESTMASGSAETQNGKPSKWMSQSFTITAETLASGDGKGAGAAGEGAGDGTVSSPPVGDNSSAFNPARVSLEDCKAAGLIY